MIQGEGPTGLSFEEDGVVYEILPLAYTGKCIKAVKRAMLRSDSDNIFDQLRTSLVVADPSVALAKLQDAMRYEYADVEKAIKNDPDAIAAALTVVCPKFKDDIQAATEFVDAYPDVPRLGLLIHAAAGVDEAGKSQRSGVRKVLDLILQRKRAERLRKLQESKSELDEAGKQSKPSPSEKSAT